MFGSPFLLYWKASFVSRAPAYTAAPPDVRKASGLPEAHGKILGYAQFWAQPRDWFDSVPAGLSHRRTSDGQAATKEGSQKPKGRLPAARRGNQVVVVIECGDPPVDSSF